MNKKPLLFRSSIAVIVLAVFALSIYPLKPLDFYDTLEKKATLHDERLTELVSKAKALQKEQGLYAPTAVEQVADEMGLDLTKYVNVKGLALNRDVISYIRQQSASSIRLGLDLNGGAEFLVRLEQEKRSAADVEEGEEEEEEPPAARDMGRDRDAAIEILRNRLESENIFESEISPVGDEMISIKVPIVSRDEKERLLQLIQRSAKLSFHLVHPDNEQLVQDYRANPTDFKAPRGYRLKENIQRKPGEKAQKLLYLIKIRPEMRGDNITAAQAPVDEFGQRYISLKFGTRGARQFSKVSGENVGRQLAIVLDGVLKSAPVIQDQISSGEARITGRFSTDEAQDIATALISGSLPVNLKIEGVFDTDPTLGKSNVQAGTWAGIIGLIAVMLFMSIYYLRAGLVANIALLANVIMILGAMATFSATLTLPGIAGIILTIGMAVDANVLIFERIREELDKNKTLANAIDTGYSRAFITILDANLTTLLTALILMWQGTGAVKGFAVTLSIGIATSMFTALFLTRLVFDLMARYMPFKSMKMLQFFPRPNINFLGLRNYTTIPSAIFCLILLVFAGIQGKQSLGIDFTGGTQLAFNYGKRIPIEEVRSSLEQAGFNSKANYKTNLTQESRELEVVMRQQDISEDESGDAVSMTERVEKVLNAAFPDAGFTGARETSLGGLVGWQFSKAAITAIILAIVGIIIYISIRFEFAFAIASIIAVMHDVIIATGIFILLGRELSLPVIAALLTIIGYSLNDTIVVFDRIREDLTLLKNRSYKEIINLSVNQTLSRTVLTSLTTLIVLLILFAAGGVAINDFVLVMLIGVVVGTYSSVFIASPIVAVWHNRIGAKLK